MNGNNLGTISNSAEIESATNNLKTNDIDSTPRNKKDGEDDISSAEVIVSIGTGTITMIFFGIITLIILIITFIIVYDKKRKEEI